MNQRFLVPINPAQIEARTNQPDFVTNPVGNQRGFRIIKNNAFLVVEPTGAFVDFGNDGVEADRKNSVPQHSFLRIKRLALPYKQTDELCDLGAELGIRSYDRGTFG